MLWLKGITDKLASSEAFSRFGLLSSYRLIDFGDVVPWSFKTQFANPPFKISVLKCIQEPKGKRNTHKGMTLQRNQINKEDESKKGSEVH